MSNQAIVPIEESQAVATLDSRVAIEQVDNASAIASKLATIIESQKVYTVIGGKRHVQVEGWTTLAAMAGFMPEEVYSKKNEDGSWESYVRLVQISTGRPMGGASMVCGGPKDKTWGKRDDYAIKSMATTRATGKACRLAFSWIMVLSGYSATPAEEMPKVREPRKPDPEAEAKKQFLAGLSCPSCGEEGMSKKTAKNGNVFFGCNTWAETKCKGTYNTDEISDLWDVFNQADEAEIEPTIETITSDDLNFG